jgi:two-component system nitrogen regulation sensor histidine kinase GlnL
MSARGLRAGTVAGPGAIEPSGILAALADPVVLVDDRRVIRYVNQAAEAFFHAGAPSLEGARLDELLPPDSPVFNLIETANASGAPIADYSVDLDTPRLGQHALTVLASPLAEPPGHVVLSIHERSIAAKLDRQLTHRNAARSVTAMAGLLAHEVKNPLSGIRGAAQLLEQNASDADRELTRLICDEADRIVALVDRMEAFGDTRPIERAAVNIHEVLERVRKVAQTGFARHVRFTETYDPSLPPVLGNHDLLVQVFLNLVKNAAEAVPQPGGEITLATAYQHGIRLAVPGSERRVHLPLLVSVIDNGEGIPEDLRAHLFDPFVTTKRNGTGLGLALVAKVVGDHGGVIEFESQPRRTVFKVYLPMASGDDSA